MYKFLLSLLLLSSLAWAQPPKPNVEVQERALKKIEAARQKPKSQVWPHLEKNWFFDNLVLNVRQPLYLNQGKPTYFCGYAALTHYILLWNPEFYVDKILELYFKGSTEVSDRTLNSSDEIRQAAGTLYNKGKMDIRHADQMWFLVLADNYKGYLNNKDKTFDMGDENNFWAASNYKKFNNMLRSLTQKEIHAKGADLIGPVFLNYGKFIQNISKDHTVILYLNNKALYPNKFFRFILPTPTHFVVLYQMEEKEGHYVLDYWDYGLRTKMNLKKRKLRRLVYGITYIP